MDKLLIFDLDDTIFETKTMGKGSMEPILGKFEIISIQKYSTTTTRKIIAELWKYPFDFVANKYEFGNQLIKEFSDLINETDYSLDIKPFKDFEHIKKITSDKILVTTGFPKLQKAKIESLRITQEFSDIYIDNVLDPNRIFKKGIFEKILSQKCVDQKSVFIIGDNTESEIKAGYELGLNTIQVSKLGQKKSKYSNYNISNYSELLEIIN
ncbi:HAD family hydrolase [Aquimarina sp. 2304DJ70-9]|uniref:HAD family hydrolase n=1 Tax=Aquimarina penaris TaxID=3231044 RepID=UPI0034635C9B